MKKNIWLGAALLSGLLTGCMDNDVYKGEERPKEYNSFDFSTVQQGVTLQLAYQNLGVEAKVYFELYDQCPVEETEYDYKKLEGVTPLYCGYTESNGTFSHTLDLPTYLTKVWIYSPAFYAQRLIVAEVKDGVITATDNAVAATRLVTETTTDYYSYMDADAPDHPTEYSDGNWKTWLGSYQTKRNGEITYPYNGNLKVTNSSEVYEQHSSVFNVNKSCPESYRCYSDISVKENAEVAITFLGQYTCWNCSMGYYYYTEGNKPASLKDANIIMLFPNTQDGSWTKKGDKVKKSAGIDRGTAIQLKYYPHIQSGSNSGATTVFPAGTRIGFVLANNAWSNRHDDYKVHKRYRAATSSGFSVHNDGWIYNEPRTAVYRYDNHLMISFEDHVDDQNFTDVVLAMKANPALAIEVTGNTPEIPKDNTITTSELRGVYAFEDLWPSQGDYDLNDVIVKYDLEKELNTKNQIISESFIFKTYQNVAANKNGLAVRLNPIESYAGNITASCYIRTAGSSEFQPTVFTYEQADKVYLLTDDVKKNMGAEYKITLTYRYQKGSGESTVQPFIYRDLANGKRWEVHIAQEAPTSKMDTSYFGKESDASKPAEGIYYVRDGQYPFAFFLAGANETDISPMLDHANESKPIDQLYKGYGSWVTSNGTRSANWYKQ